MTTRKPKREVPLPDELAALLKPVMIYIATHHSTFTVDLVRQVTGLNPKWAHRLVQRLPGWNFPTEIVNVPEEGKSRIGKAYYRLSANGVEANGGRLPKEGRMAKGPVARRRTKS